MSVHVENGSVQRTCAVDLIIKIGAAEVTDYTTLSTRGLSDILQGGEKSKDFIK